LRLKAEIAKALSDPCFSSVQGMCFCSAVSAGGQNWLVQRKKTFTFVFFKQIKKITLFNYAFVLSFTPMLFA